MWPLSRYPEILPRGEAFVKKWGVPSIFIGRFFGPLRASVPLAAGIFEMPYWRFQIANWVSALVWSAALLLFGDVIAQIAEWLWRVVYPPGFSRWQNAPPHENIFSRLFNGSHSQTRSLHPSRRAPQCGLD